MVSIFAANDLGIVLGYSITDSECFKGFAVIAFSTLSVSIFVCVSVQVTYKAMRMTGIRLRTLLFEIQSLFDVLNLLSTYLLFEKKT